MASVEDLFRALDASWTQPNASRIRLSVIGSAALMARADYARRTKDCDVLQTSSLDLATSSALIALAGKGTPFAARQDAYIEVVGNGIPFLPTRALWHGLDELNADLRHFEVEVLDVVDVCVAKRKRLNANDREDILAMIERNLVPHVRLLERFESAVDAFACDARAEDLPHIVRNFHWVERDAFDLPPTEIELPSWIDSD